MAEEELTQEAFDKLRDRVQVLEELLFVEMKLTADRTDISACDKVNKFKAFIEQVREDVDEEDAPPTPPEPDIEIKEFSGVDSSNGATEDTNGANGENNLKRPADDDGNPEATEAKAAKTDSDGAPGGAKEGFGDGGEDSGADDDADVDCCVVCGLHRGVFREDTGKELHHYLSHGFNILKEFDILKPDDSIFLICNICNSPFPRKCHVNFRKHLVSEHTERIVEIFREC